MSLTDGCCCACQMEWKLLRMPGLAPLQQLGAALGRPDVVQQAEALHPGLGVSPAFNDHF